MKNIKFLVMDVDGTLTDGKIYLMNSGDEIKAFNIKDGYGIKNRLLGTSITPVVITGRSSSIVDRRCKELGITHVYQGINNKLQKLVEITKDLNFVAYIGDDDNDLECMEEVKKYGGIIGCPNDASESVKKISNYISSYNGGDGAVRDFIDWLLKQYK
ncbi:MAG: HAD hydrolase family protein [Bacilli bacterium]|nr:HAD hydrolase family protein [Bacilli bacterium]